MSVVIRMIAQDQSFVGYILGISFISLGVITLILMIYHWIKDVRGIKVE